MILVAVVLIALGLCALTGYVAYKLIDPPLTDHERETIAEFERMNAERGPQQPPAQALSDSPTVVAPNSGDPVPEDVPVQASATTTPPPMVGEDAKTLDGDPHADHDHDAGNCWLTGVIADAEAAKAEVDAA